MNSSSKIFYGSKNYLEIEELSEDGMIIATWKYYLLIVSQSKLQKLEPKSFLFAI